MPKVLASRQIAELEGEFDEDFRPDYSGRGMYGKTCIGYTGEYPFYFAARLAYLLNDGDEMDANDLVYAIEGLPECSTDSMGRGTIYYWPAVRAEAGAST